jgi:predicted ATPase
MPATTAQTASRPEVIHTPDQRVRVFVSSTLQELAPERDAAREAVDQLRLVPVMFELGARPHPPRDVYRAYLSQSQIFIGIYWQSYGWVSHDADTSGIEDEYQLAAGLPRLIYVKSPAPDRDPRLADMIARIEADGSVSYQPFSDPAELQRLVEDDLATLLSERFEMTRPTDSPAELSGALPAPATPLVDRDHEAAEVEELIVCQGVRLITFTGPGGVGKSRLALAAAARLAAGFQDGVRFVDLASISAPELVPAAIASRLGLTRAGSRIVSDLVSYLRSKRLLLLLDNFEQVTDAGPLVAELLAAAPGLVIMVTSRRVLRLTGEFELCVPPLSIPPAAAADPASAGARVDGDDVASLQDYAAVRLFIARARAASPGFELTPRNARAIAGICRALDGLPLAIELAAAWIRLLPPQALLQRLDDRMSLLTGGPRDLPERQRTLRSTLDWSFGLLSAAEQALFTRLGVFSGTFGLPAVTAVCGDVVATGSPAEPARVMALLGRLVDSSLIRAEPHDDEPRFSLLETIREYALDRLRESGGWEDVHDRHAAYFLALAKPTEAELRGAGQLAWLNRLEVRHENVSAALSWLLQRGQTGLALDLIWETWRFWWLHGHAQELARHVDKIFAQSDRLPVRQRALALSGAGLTYFAGGDQVRARRLMKQSLPLYRQAGDRLGMGLTAAALGHLLAADHKIAIAADLLGQTLAQLREMAGEPMTEPERMQYLLDVALASNFLGQIILSQGENQRAADLFTEGLSAAHNSADRFTILVSLYDLALSRQAQNDLDDATDLFTQGLSFAAEVGDEPTVAYYLEAMAEIAARRGQPDRAITLIAAAGALLEANGSGWLHAYVPRAPHGDSTLASLRARTTEPAFEQAWAYGRSHTCSSAILAYTIGQVAAGLRQR